MTKLNRRHFLASAAAAGTLAATGLAGPPAEQAAELVVGVMGTGGRGTGLATTFARQPGVTVAYVCDVDQERVRRAAEAVGRVAGGREPQAVGDFRRILDDRDVNILVVATCNHWHAPA